MEQHQYGLLVSDLHICNIVYTYNYCTNCGTTKETLDIQIIDDEFISHHQPKRSWSRVNTGGFHLIYSG